MQLTAYIDRSAFADCDRRINFSTLDILVLLHRTHTLHGRIRRPRLQTTPAAPSHLFVRGIEHVQYSKCLHFFCSNLLIFSASSTMTNRKMHEFPSASGISLQEPCFIVFVFFLHIPVKASASASFRLQ